MGFDWKWIELEANILGEVIQIWKDKHCMFSPILGYQNLSFRYVCFGFNNCRGEVASKRREEAVVQREKIEYNVIKR